MGILSSVRISTGFPGEDWQNESFTFFENLEIQQ